MKKQAEPTAMEPSDIEAKTPGAESWEKLFLETLGRSSRKPFSGTIKVCDQVLELFDSANQFFYLSDYSSLRMLYVSPNIFHVLGFQPHEFDFRTLFEMIHPDDRKPVFEVAKMVLNREMTYISGNTDRHVVLYMSYRGARKSGRYSRISLTISRHIDPVGGVYDMGVIRDITHVRCGTRVNFALLGRRPIGELPAIIPDGGNTISKREQEIIYYISMGYSSRKIACELNLSEHTVNTHRKNILRKTGTRNLVDMLLYAATNGII